MTFRLLLETARGWWRQRPPADPPDQHEYTDPALVTEALGKLEGNWPERIRLVRECPDNAFIPRVPEAGKLEDGMITMHNGIRVSALGYYGAGILNLLVENKGVHEPQEERVFAEALKTLPEKAVMVELGAYWGFYSIWFRKQIRNGTTYLIEPRAANIESGRLNFKINQVHGDFTRAWIGGPSTVSPNKVPVVQIDTFAREKGISFIHLLHSDIQGAELEMLEGGKEHFTEHRIGYLFLSTHSIELHDRCLTWLQDLGYEVVSSATPEESYSYDGVLIVRSPEFEGLAPIEISRRTGAGICATAKPNPIHNP